MRARRGRAGVFKTLSSASRQPGHAAHLSCLPADASGHWLPARAASWKPCLAASRRRSSPNGTGRISPASPSSPNAISEFGTGTIEQAGTRRHARWRDRPRFRRDARHPPRSRTHPDHLQLECRHDDGPPPAASSGDCRRCPTATRRGLAPVLASARALELRSTTTAYPRASP